MNKAILFNFTVDKETNSIKVERSFNGPVDLVWAAWTDADILDQWWAPRPYRAVTKSQTFKEGGQWHYYMLGPEGDRHWCLFNYKVIKPLQYYSGDDAFCDENAVPNNTKPVLEWENTFTGNGDSTTVNVLMKFKSFEDIETIIQMGMKEGFSAALENLDRYIAAQFALRRQNKPDNRARTSTYINTQGKTEEAFNFYKAVFKTEFVGGIHRFGEIPTEAGHPPVADEVKKMVLHIELPILGGHILMGTDSPKEMDFTLSQGNNMHINLEPESREEATRLFNELSAGGKVEMPIQDMFWGAYFGSFTDKYGINWMVNYQER